MTKLGFIDICGIPFEVVERTVEEDAHLEDCYGYCQAMACRIVLREGLPPELFRLTLTHEGFHGLFEHLHLKSFCEITVKKDEFEENFIQIVTPHVIKMFSSFKNLKIK